MGFPALNPPAHPTCSTHLLRVQAFAGCGKTTTLKRLAEAYPTVPMLYTSFNKCVPHAGVWTRAAPLCPVQQHGKALAHVLHVWEPSGSCLSQHLHALLDAAGTLWRRPRAPSPGTWHA